MTRTVVKAEKVNKLFYKMYFDDSAERSPTYPPVPVLKAETLAGRKAAAKAELLGQFKRSSSVEVLGMKSSEFAGLPGQETALQDMFDKNHTILQYFSQFPMSFIDSILLCGEYRYPAADKPALRSSVPDEQTIYQDGNNDTFWDISYSIRLLELIKKVGGEYPEEKNLFLPLTLRFKFTDDGPQLHSLITDSPAFADLFTLDWTDQSDAFVQQVVSIARERNNELAYRVDLKKIMELKPSENHYFLLETQAYDGCFAALENSLEKAQFFEQTKLLITDESLAAFGGRTESGIAQDYNRMSPVIFGKPYVELDKKDLTWSNIKKGITPPASVDSKTWFAELDRRMFRYSQQPAYLMDRPFVAMKTDERFCLETDDVSFSFYFKDRKYLYDVMMDVLRFEEITFAGSTIHKVIHEVPGKIKLTFEMTAEQGTKLMHAQFSNKVLRDHFLGQPLLAKDFIEKCRTAEEEQKRAEAEQKSAEAEQHAKAVSTTQAEILKVRQATKQAETLKDLSTLKFQLEGAIKEEVWGEEGEIKEEVALAKIDMKIDEILYSKDVFDALQTFLKGSKNLQINKAVTVRVCQAKVQRALNSLPSFETENREQGSIETTQADENPLHTGGGEAIRTGSIVDTPKDLIDTVNSLETRLKDVHVRLLRESRKYQYHEDEEKRQSILYPTASVAVPKQSPAAAQVRQEQGIYESLLRRVVSGDVSLMKRTVAGLKGIASQQQASISAIKTIKGEVLAYLKQHKSKFMNKVGKACKEGGRDDPSDDELIKKIISGDVKPSRWSRKSVNTAILGLKLMDRFEKTPQLIDNPQMLKGHINALVQKRNSERNWFERVRRDGISRLSAAFEGTEVAGLDGVVPTEGPVKSDEDLKALWGSDYRFVEESERARQNHAEANHSNDADQADPVASVKKPFRQWYVEALKDESVFTDDEMRKLSGLVCSVTTDLVLLMEDEAPKLTEEAYAATHGVIDAINVRNISKEKSPLYHAIAREVKKDLLARLGEVKITPSEKAHNDPHQKAVHKANVAVYSQGILEKDDVLSALKSMIDDEAVERKVKDDVTGCVSLEILEHSRHKKSLLNAMNTLTDEKRDQALTLLSNDLQKEINEYYSSEAKHKRGINPKFTKAFVIDFDGVINHVLGDAIPGSFNYTYRKDFLERSGDHFTNDTNQPRPIAITYNDYIKAVFKILVHNNILVLVGSQRASYEETKQNTFGTDMWKAFDECFDSKRAFLQKDIGKFISDTTDYVADSSKNRVLRSVASLTRLEHENIELFDDNWEYHTCKEEGFGFTQVDRGYLYESSTLCRRSEDGKEEGINNLQSLDFLGDMLQKAGITTAQLADSMVELRVEDAIQENIKTIFRGRAVIGSSLADSAVFVEGSSDDGSAVSVEGGSDDGSGDDQGLDMNDFHHKYSASKSPFALMPKPSQGSGVTVTPGSASIPTA